MLPGFHHMYLSSPPLPLSLSLSLSLSLLFTEKKGKFLNLDHFTQLSKLEHILVIFNSANSLADFFLNPILLSNADFILKYVNMSDIHEKRYLSDKLL